MISASHPGEALAQLQLGHLGHLYPAPPPAAMTPEFLTPPPRPYPRYAARRPRDPPAHTAPAPPPAPAPHPPPPAPFAGYAPFLPHAPYAYLYGARPQPPAAYPLRARSSSGFVPPAPAPAPAPHRSPAPVPHEQPPPAPAPVPPSIEEAPMSPERGAPAPYFCRGAMIRLEDGSLRRVEEMRTEDFVSSAGRSAHLALTKCTLLRLDERGDNLALTLTYDRNRTQVELDWTVDRPFFVYGRGWASCKPERTLARYGLRVQRLQVGDVCVSLVAKSHTAANGTVTSNLGVNNVTSCLPAPPQTHPENLSVKEDARKRRWSAPDVNDDDRPPLKKR
ncbi:PREDICTED: ataxin-1-like [Papilio xuthus]|uniref:Ataxin-1 n=1 Tax=Papilio xuthus TaxID=66420 RepID=A0A194PWA4_PAPXU|nr:PREDICTED: ataxin-1-like [Papilio xuthus]KPI97283.1 Ataxin-1 [Papilio xuthus]